ncbi:hypothetical protein THASP1DRAFT_34492 [Thamnocephalis sphaerospora]|uniref:Uncharacterized protein n=1 Tax=Thamnocephalis sphaerospora TaxID=78915 RepID=A0A4V1IWX6_9FUNG|nr:hypothetical protein THASP1DRAFT_34492 [Thamnocephalis sphaerospora]|eukprot:RKP09089.1 hypothetical protein THASP1DRAFT_34492 [Thamnocephalis sphaerospora]
MTREKQSSDRIKNKNPAPVQITAEQLMREAHEFREVAIAAPRQKITDKEELAEYQMDKRRSFEDMLRRNRIHVGTWLNYAAWEQSQDEITRARSIYERALDVDARNVTVYLKYLEMEMKNRNVNRARNLFDRVVALLPRVDQFWLKFTYMEEMLGNVNGARQIFERWMQWQPEEPAWMAYAKMEMRYGEVDRARAVYQRFVQVHPDPKNWLKWVRFEEEQNNIEQVREIFDQAFQFLGDDHMDQKLVIAFAKFESKQREYERARAIFKYALERLPKHKSEALYKQYTQFEKRFGDKDDIETVVMAKRRGQYEQQVRENPRNYDVWFDYARLEEATADVERTREVYERAIAQVPPSEEKRHWRRYIYLWINYALFEELVAKDYERTRQIYQECLRLIPHKKFTFAKIWLLAARFEIRRLNLTAARKTLGMGIGKAPKDRLFKGYIELELELREFDRCRTLYTKFLEYNPANCYAWIRFAELERSLGDYERARAIFELAVAQPALDMPELLWKAYIDFEVEMAEFASARKLYERLLQRTEHVKVWISYARFELEAVAEDEDPAEREEERAERARKTFQRAYDSMKQRDLKEERVLLLEAWREMEAHYGDAASRAAVAKRMPKVVKRRRKVEGEEGAGAGAWEEYYDYIFPDDETQKPNLKLLELAYQLKSKREAEARAKAASASTSASAPDTEETAASDDEHA